MITSDKLKKKEKLHRRYAKFLAPGEEVVYASGISNRYFWSYFLLYLPMSLLLVGIPKLSRLLHQKRANVYVLTTHKLLIIKGIFAIKVVTALLDRVTHVTVNQSFADRFFYNSGDIIVITAGFDKREIVIENIPNPIRFKVLLEELTERFEASKPALQDRGDVSAAVSKIRPLKLSGD